MPKCTLVYGLLLGLAKASYDLERQKVAQSEDGGNRSCLKLLDGELLKEFL